MLINYYFFLINKSSKTGTHFVYLRATKNQTSKYVSTGVDVNKSNWSKKNQRVKSRDRDYVFKNNILEAINTNARTILLNSLVENKKLSLSDFLSQLKNNKTEELNFFEFAEKVKVDKKHLISESTFKNYGYQNEKIRSFKKSFSVLDINLDFINKYDQHLINHFKNNDNTRIKSLTYLRMICNEALKNDVITKTPFSVYKIKAMTSREEFLSKTELEKLEKLFIEGDLKQGERITLKAFLFGCYTGISFSDLGQLKFKNILTINVKGVDYKLIDFQRTKTGNKFRVPLIPKAVKLLDQKFSENQELFKTMVNQAFNRNLKKIKVKAKITTDLTFHLSRHTFGTHATSMGIPQNIVMEMMGHKDIKVNNIYSKLQNEALINAMVEKWEDAN